MNIYFCFRVRNLETAGHGNMYKAMANLRVEAYGFKESMMDRVLWHTSGQAWEDLRGGPGSAWQGPSIRQTKDGSAHNTFRWNGNIH